jgi:acyl-CoA thioesterase-1
VILLLSVSGCGGQPETGTTPGDAATSNPVISEPSASDPASSNDTNENAVRILFLGDSITAGLGVDQLEAFPARVEMRLIEAGYTVEAIDAGVSGDTSTGGLNRLNWLLQNRVDIMVLELGGNDGLRGIDLSLTRANLGAIIERTRNAWPQARIVLVGMRVPPNLGPDYTEEFASIYPEVSAEYDTYFAPFIADGFEDIVHLLQNDGIHPTEEGHAVIAEKVGDVVEPLVAELDKTS